MDDESNQEKNPLAAVSKQFLRIPLKRIGAVIGPKGAIRKEIEAIYSELAQGK